MPPVHPLARVMVVMMHHRLIHVRPLIGAMIVVAVQIHTQMVAAAETQPYYYRHYEHLEKILVHVFS